jgi:hypothetical protein
MKPDPSTAAFAMTMAMHANLAALAYQLDDANSDHFWDETSSCSCDVCNHRRTAGEFRITADKAVQA